MKGSKHIKMHSVKEAFNYLQSFYNSEKNGIYNSRIYRLDRMKNLLSLFNNPHLKLNAIHIAGSKGKGSTASITASILTEFGYKTGIYASPHLVDYRERITLNGSFFYDKMYIDAIKTIKKKNLLEQKNPPTLFELLTLLSFMIFKEAKCTAVVIETGLGGRLDATNCILPKLSIITRIEKEHEEYLGDTIEKIAAEKGGIIKPQTAFLLTKQISSVENVLLQIAQKKEATVFKTTNWGDLPTYKIKRKKYIADFQILNNKIKVKLPSPGKFQGENSQTAAIGAIIFDSIVKNRNTKKFILSKSIINKLKKGIEKTKMHGRIELISTNPNIYIDGAHTPISFNHSVETFNKLEGKKGVLLFSAVEGKNSWEMIKQLKNNFNSAIITTTGNFRKSNPEKLYNEMARVVDNCKKIENIENAFLSAKIEAKINNEAILITGSFFLIGEIIKL